MFTHFCIISAVILLLLMFSAVFRRMTQGGTNRCYLMLVFLSLLMAGSEFLLTAPDKFRYLLPFAHYLFFIMLVAVPLILMTYTVCLTDTGHLLSNQKVMGAITVVTIVATLGLIITNIFSNFVFEAIGTSVLRHWGIIPLYLGVIIFTIIGIYYLLKYRRYISAGKSITLVLTFIAVGAITLVQLLEPRIYLCSTVYTMCLLLISITTHRPEERIDMSTGLNKSQAYYNDLQRDYDTKKAVYIIFVDILNIKHFKNMLSLEMYNLMLEDATQRIQAATRNFSFVGNTQYYLGNGRFRMVIYDPDTERIFQYANSLKDAYSSDVEIKKIMVSYKPIICCINALVDFESFESLRLFESTYLSTTAYTSEVLVGSELIKQDKYRHISNIDALIYEGFQYQRFDVFFQPIISLKEGYCESAEALIRLKDEYGNYISPALFIPFAEQNGDIHIIGDFVLRTVFEFMSGEEYKASGLNSMEINLSVVQLMQPDLADTIIEYAKHYNVNPVDVFFEITETAAEYSQDTIFDNITALHNAGFRFSLDDYGTGYSNISRFVEIPLTVLKLDKTFADNLHNERLPAVLKHTVRMAKDLNMKIIVEGVETEDALTKFKELECDLIQGYYFSAPLPRDKFIQFANNYNHKASANQ